MKTVSENRCFGGVQGVYTHASQATGTEMTFGLFLPAEAEDGPVPVLWYLSGLTCTHENAMVKAGAQAWAAEQGIALVFPDTSPRGEGVADDDAYDLGQGAGFYVNATREPWAPHFRMWDYVADELPRILDNAFPIDPERQAITGHSMGGHGALTIAIGNPDRYQSVSALAPICNPSTSEWGRKQLTAYLGDDEGAWENHDAVRLLDRAGWKGELLVDQGSADPFLDKLGPDALGSACERAGAQATIRIHEGYDHSYWFVQSFLADHIEWHAARLRGSG